MHTSATEERTALVEAVRDFAATALAPYAGAWDAEKHFPVDTLRQAGDLGLGGIYASEDVGGSALSRMDAVAIFEELAKGDTTIAAYISIHNMVVWMIDTFGDAAQRARWLPRLTRMEDLGSYCLTEPGAGSDAAAITTAARREGDEYVIDGVKQFISGAGSSAVYVVMARTGMPGSKGISAIVVPAVTPVLSFGPKEKKMGWNAQPTRQVVFDGVRVPVSHRLSAEGDGFTIAMRGLNGGRVNMGAVSLGGAQWTLDRAVAYVQERETFGLPLSANQSVVFTLAEMETQLQAARALLQRAAAKMDDGAADAPAACALAKRFATDAAFQVANEALQLHGGYGYLHDYGIERVVRDLRVHQILEGTNEMMKLIVGRALLAGTR
ncbi:MAG: acyl-CoA dehydrogenase family protein [Microbacterium sp.]|nr:acyl-CoA dehydrogenase family protein [Microbacterium sp.]